MSQRQDYLELEHEEYTTRVMVFQTDFKGSYISDFEKGFSNQKFVGTREQYDEAIKFYDNHDNGKIIGTHVFTLEEWEQKHKMPELVAIGKSYTELDKYFDDIFEEKRPQREKNRRGRELE